MIEIEKKNLFCFVFFVLFVCVRDFHSLKRFLFLISHFLGGRGLILYYLYSTESPTLFIVLLVVAAHDRITVASDYHKNMSQYVVLETVHFFTLSLGSLCNLME